jgi:hypothetical protein
MKSKKSNKPEEPKEKRWAGAHFVDARMIYPPSREPEILAYVNNEHRNKYYTVWRGMRIPTREPHEWHKKQDTQRALDWLIQERLNSDPVLQSLGIYCRGVDTDYKSTRTFLKAHHPDLNDNFILELEDYPQPFAFNPQGGLSEFAERYGGDPEPPPHRETNGNHIVPHIRNEMAAKVAIAEERLDPELKRMRELEQEGLKQQLSEVIKRLPDYGRKDEKPPTVN